MAETSAEEKNIHPSGAGHADGHQAHPKGNAKSGKGKKENKGPVAKALPFIFLAILIAGGFYGWHIIQYNKVHENTDDAQIDVDITPIIPRVSGYVAAVNVSENDRVDSNVVLVRLDTNDLVLKVKSAEAALSNVQASVRSAEASVSVAHSNAATAEVNRRKAAEDLVRANGLYAGSAITKEKLDGYRSADEVAAAQLKSAADMASASEAQVGVAQSQIAQKQVDLDNAKLQLSYATIAAPVAGIIAKKNVEIGEFIQAGQPIMALTQGDIWITANFKETQMFDIKQGQRVEFTLDSYPDSTFHGTVQSVSPATGAKFSLLPPDNSTGNFVKVTQRVPVKILVDRGDYSKSPLRPGMSVDVTVSTGK
jgi:membrane fusion protein (multidrug efflux system)